MSIKSLFEDVADAIRVTSGSDDTYTPAEMPQAIRNFSSIFQTKTLSSPIGGQTTVEGCLSSLSSDLSELKHQVVAEITCDGVKTNAQCFDAIEGDITEFLNEHGRDKFVNMTLVWVTPAGVIDTYHPLGCSSTYYTFIRPTEISGGNTLYTYTAIIGVGSSSSALNSSTTTASGTTFANRASAVPSSGTKLRVLYN